MATDFKFALHELLGELPALHVVDIGASSIDGAPPYQKLLDFGAIAQLTCFEPNPREYETLNESAAPGRRYLPYAIGDGRDATLNICAAPGMSSLLEPNQELLRHFFGFSAWAAVVKQVPIQTHRLDDVPDLGPVDYLKLDVQGSELSILQNAPRTLQQTLLVHVEMPFLPLYCNQPLFGELDALLRNAGFVIHCITRLSKRALQPVMKNDKFGGFNQLFEADAVYVRDFTKFAQLDPPSLLKIARMVHDLWGSIDLAALALSHVDRQTGTKRQMQYRQRLMGEAQA